MQMPLARDAGTTRWTLIAPLAIVAVAIVAKLVMIQILDWPVRSDGLAYYGIATGLVEHGVIATAGGKIAFMNPGYGIFLAPFFFVFGDSVLLVQIINVLLGALSAYLVYRICLHFFADPFWPMIAGLAWAVYMPNLRITELVGRENLVVPLMLLQTLIMLRFSASRHKLLLAVALGALLPAHLLVGSVAAPFAITAVPVIAGLWPEFWSPKRWRWGLIAVYCVVAAVLLAPWFTYTYQKLGAPVMSTNFGFNLYMGNNPATEATKWKGIEETPMAEEWKEMLNKYDEVERSKIMAAKAFRYMWDNPGRTVSLTIGKAIRYWTPPVQNLDLSRMSTEMLGRLIWLVQYILIVAFFLYFLVAARPWKKDYFVLLAAIFLYFSPHALFYFIPRFRLPVMPFVLIFAVMAVHQLWVRIESRRLSERSQPA